MTRKWFESDSRGVSPVIGVILMVAITVILAAVIGTFVLGLGESVGNSAPQAQFEFEYDDGGDGFGDANDWVNVTHTGGEVVDNGTIDVAIAGSTAAPDVPFDSRITASNSSHFNQALNSGEPVEIIWTSPSGDTSAVIAESEVP